MKAIASHVYLVFVSFGDGRAHAHDLNRVLEILDGLEDGGVGECPVRVLVPDGVDGLEAAGHGALDHSLLDEVERAPHLAEHRVPVLPGRGAVGVGQERLARRDEQGGAALEDEASAVDLGSPSLLPVTIVY